MNSETLKLVKQLHNFYTINLFLRKIARYNFTFIELLT